MERLVRQRGLTSGSELLRRLIDEAPLRGEEPGLLAHVRLPSRGADLADLVAELEQRMIEQALRRAEGSVSAAARLLRMPRTTLQKKMRLLGVPAAQASKPAAPAAPPSAH